MASNRSAAGRGQLFRVLIYPSPFLLFLVRVYYGMFLAVAVDHPLAGILVSSANAGGSRSKSNGQGTHKVRAIVQPAAPSVKNGN